MCAAIDGDDSFAVKGVATELYTGHDSAYISCGRNNSPPAEAFKQRPTCSAVFIDGQIWTWIVQEVHQCYNEQAVACCFDI